MTYIKESDEKRLAAHLLARDISSTLTVYMARRSDSSSAAMLDLVDYLVSLAPSRLKRNLERFTNSQDGPRLRISSALHPDPGIEFWGAPSGHEFSSLVHAIELVTGIRHTLDPVTLALLHQLGTITPVKIYVTPT